MNQHHTSPQQRHGGAGLLKQPSELLLPSVGKHPVMEKNYCPAAQLSTAMLNCGQPLVTAMTTTTTTSQATPITLPAAGSTALSKSMQTPQSTSRASRQQANRPRSMTRHITGATNSVTATSCADPAAVPAVASSSSSHAIAATAAPFRSSTTPANSSSVAFISQSTNCLVSSGFANSSPSPFMNCLNGHNATGSNLSLSTQQQQSRAISVGNPNMITYPIDHYGANQFLNNLIRMEQTKIWEDAKCRTFYARDNVCNFIEWSKEFGVNQSVLFESDDLVLHANPRQVVLCLLDVARIAYVKYGFTEAPGLVKFEQEIDREIAAADNGGRCRDGATSNDDEQDPSVMRGKHNNGTPDDQKRSRRGISLATDATDELIMRYCRHKEEEAARRKSDEVKAAAAAAAAAAAEAAALAAAEEAANAAAVESSQEDEEEGSGINASSLSDKLASNTDDNNGRGPNDWASQRHYELDSLIDDGLKRYPSIMEIPSKTTTVMMMSNGQTVAANCDENGDSKLDTNNLLDRIDSLDSAGEGPAESSSTGRGSSQTPSASGSSSAASKQPDYNGEDIATTPIPAKRSHFSPIGAMNMISHSELSSSRSSLLSVCQDNEQETPSAGSDGGGGGSGSGGRQITSDLDGKVMRIAKSYYGKSYSKGVTRLSEGKYKIADRIVFVRLLKGHRVMVRIGGGWDTLENFLFRHKSDPSQVIDVDNLLPLETKMAFDKSANPSHNKSISKLPYYGRSNSASSTNLSVSNRSFSDHSLTNATNQPKTKPLLTASSTIDTSSPVTSGSTSTLIQSAGPTPTHYNKSSLSTAITTTTATKSPYFLIHRTRLPHSAFHNHLPSSEPASSINSKQQQQLTHGSKAFATNGSRLPKAKMNQLTPSYVNKYHQRPLASSRAPTASATNLYPATLTTRLTPTYITGTGAGGRSRANLTNTSHNNNSTKNNSISSRKLGRSSDSIQQLKS